MKSIYYNKIYRNIFLGNEVMPLSELLNRVSKYTNIPKSAILAKGRKREIVDARHAFMLIADKMNCYIQEEIEHFVNKSHGALFQAYKKKDIPEIKDIINNFSKNN